MQNITEAFTEQGFGRAQLREGCPITGPNLDDVRRKRQAMLANGYPLVAVHTPWSPFADPASAGKQPLTEMEDGQKVPWCQGHSLRRLLRVTPYSANTGTTLGGTTAVCAIDLDPAKTADDADQAAFATAVLQLLHADRLWPDLRQGLFRLRLPASVVILLRTNGAISKRSVAGQHGAVDLLCDGCHVVVDGWHPRSLAGGPLIQWRWYRDRTPWTVPAAELPIVHTAELATLMQRIEAAGVLGAARKRKATATVMNPPKRVVVLEATERLHALYEKYNGLVRPAIRELVQEIGAENRGRHNAVVAICGRLVLQRWTDQKALDFLVPLVNQSFGEGDWTEEVRDALTHARRREAARLGSVKKAIWR